MDSNPICQPSPANRMKCYFLDYVQLLMIGWASQWTQTPSSTSLQPKKWNAHFCIMFNFWWSARLVNGLEPHLPPISSQKNEMLIFGLCSTSDDWPGWLMDSNPICHPSPPKNMKCLFLYNIQHLMLARLVNRLKPHLPPLFSQKNEMLFFGLRSTSDDWPGWLMDSNPICHPSPAKKWNVYFWIMFNFWWLAGLVNGIEKKWNACFWIMFTSDDLPGWLMNLPPSATPLLPKKWNAQFLITFNFWWSTKLINGLKPHLPPLSSQKNEMLLFWIPFNFWWLAWLRDGLKPHPPSLSSQKNEMLNLEYIQLLMIGRAGRWTQTPSTTHLQPIKWNAHFLIMLNFWWSAGLVNGLEPHLPALSSQ